jgi:hypothetical protein
LIGKVSFRVTFLPSGLRTPSGSLSDIPSRSAGETESQTPNPTGGMHDLLDVHTKPKVFKKLLRLARYTVAGLRAHNFSWRLIRNSQDEEPAALIGDCYAILAKLSKIVLLFSFFELNPLMLRLEAAPDIDLV